MNSKTKYQFFISYRNSVKASAASKPILDSCETLKSLGYEDHSITFDHNKKSFRYYSFVLNRFLRFFVRIKKGSVVATQYPVPTIGYFLVLVNKILKFRHIALIAIIHDINTLRLQKLNEGELRKEIRMLNAYHGLIVHNEIMKDWLIHNGLSKSIKTVSLEIFDYISSSEKLSDNTSFSINNEIAFAGHLAKSLFVYELDHIKRWKFNIYGSDFNTEKNRNINTTWKGEFSPDEIVYNLEGSFGLVWDGIDSNNIETNTFGNYMRYNNPFKFSLYIAAGLPVIAPRTAAVASTITDYNIGFLINNLDDLNEVEISNEQYQVCLLYTSPSPRDS